MSLENDSSVSRSDILQIIPKSELGSISVSVKTLHSNYIIQLLDNRFNVVSESINNPEHTFTNIGPSTYRLRMIVDTNGDGRWSPGNILIWQLPEPVSTYKSEDGIEKIILSANWEIGHLELQF